MFNSTSKSLSTSSLDMQIVKRAPSQEMTEYKPDPLLYHPLFAEGDTVLSPKGGEILFRVYSHTLKMTSGFFRSMFSLPQSASSSPSSSNSTNSPSNGIFYLEEDKETLEYLLRMMCGLPLPTVETTEQLEALLEAVEKYDTPGPLSIIRLLVMTPTFNIHPFKLYGVACRFGWEAEAKHASTQTLAYNLLDAEVRPLLQRLSTDSLLKLLDLHRSRREGLRQRLNDTPFVSGATATCINCSSHIDYHTWRELKYKIILEIDVRPLGDTVVDVGLRDWPEATACWNAKCPLVNCSRNLYDKNETLRVIRDCVEKLPKTI